VQDPDDDKPNEVSDGSNDELKARLMARWREDQLRLYRVELKMAERRGFEQGLREAREENRERGRNEAARALARRLLEMRFGPLDESTLARLGAADQATLDQYVERVLTADSLAEVFES
jgi:flagellar biosynthesis/type III secretory pathway protein FliH